MALQTLAAELALVQVLVEQVEAEVQVSSSLLTQPLEPLKKLTTQDLTSNGGVLLYVQLLPHNDQTG